MTKCCVRSCQNGGGHQFPKCPILRQKWIHAVRRRNWEPTTKSLVCQAHFDSSSFIKEGFHSGIQLVRKRLKAGALPTLFEWSKNTQLPHIARKNLTLKMETQTQTQTTNKVEENVVIADESPNPTLHCATESINDGDLATTNVAVNPSLLPVKEEDNSRPQPMVVMCDIKQEPGSPYGDFTNSNVADVAVDPYLLPVKLENDYRPQPFVLIYNVKQEPGTPYGGLPDSDQSMTVAVDPLLVLVNEEDDSILQPIATCNIKQEPGHAVGNHPEHSSGQTDKLKLRAVVQLTGLENENATSSERIGESIPIGGLSHKIHHSSTMGFTRMPEATTSTSRTQQRHKPRRGDKIEPDSVMETIYARPNPKRKRQPKTCSFTSLENRTPPTMTEVENMSKKLKAYNSDLPIAYLLSPVTSGGICHVPIGEVPIGSTLSHQLRTYLPVNNYMESL